MNDGRGVGVGRIAGSVAETPFALSLVVGLFFAARKMAAIPTLQHRPASVV